MGHSAVKILTEVKVLFYFRAATANFWALLNDLVWIFPKSIYQTTRLISEKIDRTVLFQGCHGQFLVSIKRSGLDIWKKISIKRPVLSFFSNSRSLEQPGLIIESLEYTFEHFLIIIICPLSSWCFLEIFSWLDI